MRSGGVIATTITSRRAPGAALSDDYPHPDDLIFEEVHLRLAPQIRRKNSQVEVLLL